MENQIKVYKKIRELKEHGVSALVYNDIVVVKVLGKLKVSGYNIGDFTKEEFLKEDFSKHYRKVQ